MSQLRPDLEKFSQAGELKCSVCLNAHVPLNEVKTGKKAFANMPADGDEAIALLCGDCMGRNAQPTFLIQYDQDRIINHYVEIDRLVDLSSSATKSKSRPTTTTRAVDDSAKLDEKVAVKKIKAEE